MKLFGLITIALSTLACFTSAQKERHYKGLIFWVSGKTATVRCLDSNNLKAKEITIPAYYVDDDGVRYTVNDVYPGAFANSDLETVTINGSNLLKLEHRAFGDCKKLKKVNVYNPNLIVDSNAFNGCNPIEFDGWATRTLADRFASDLLSQWQIKSKKGYDVESTEAREMKMKDLYQLAKLIRKNFKLGYGCGNNLACSIYFRTVSHRGIHMLFQKLAVKMGVNENNILVGGDGKSVFWNYVRFDRDKYDDTWENVDIYMFDFEKNGDNNYSKLYQKRSSFVTYLWKNLNYMIYDAYIHEDPSKWYKYESCWGFPYEGKLDKKVNFNEYLKTLKNPGYRD